MIKRDKVLCAVPVSQCAAALESEKKKSERESALMDSRLHNARAFIERVAIGFLSVWPSGRAFF